MAKARVPAGPFVIAYILTPIAETNLRSGLVIYDGSYLPLLTRPVCAAFLALAAASLVWSLWSELRPARKEVAR